MSEIKKTGVKKSAEKKQRKKKLAKAAIFVLIILAVLLVINFFIDKYEEEKRKAMEIPVYGELEFKNEGLPTPDYYTPDYETDIFSDKEYLDAVKGKGVIYTDGNISFDLNDRGDESLTAGQRFFKNYFYAVNHADLETYSGMFAPEYEGNPTIYGRKPWERTFPMQRLYDVNVKELFVSDNIENTYNGKHAIFGVYEVRYCIQKNDGEFRYNLVSDTVLPVIYQTVTTDAGTASEKTLITKVYYYTDISDEAVNAEE